MRYILSEMQRCSGEYSTNLHLTGLSNRTLKAVYNNQLTIPKMNPSLNIAALPFPQINPVLLELGPLQIHWYGIGYVVGLLFGWWYSRKLFMKSQLFQPMEVN